MEYALQFAATLSVIVLVLYSILRRSSAIRDIPGPPSPSWIFGNLRQLLLSPVYGEHEFNWLSFYGSVYSLRACFGENRLMVADPLALQYILNSPKFYRAPILNNMAILLFGDSSVITARGNEHRRLRAGLNPGFTTAAVRSYHPVFKKVAEMLDNFTTTNADVCSVLSPATLDAISEAILGRPTKDLGAEFAANNIEIVKLTASQSETHILADAIGSRLPAWVWRAAIYLPTAAFAVARQEKFLAKQVGGRIVRENRAAATLGLERGNDFFSVLLDPETAEKTKTLTDQDIVAQTALILIAGQETTASFGLLELARHPDFQDKLRAEIYANSAAIVADLAYENMPLLNAFLKETLRLYPAVPLADRVALEDAIIPLGESIVSFNGERINQIAVRKGEVLALGIASYQRLASRWGKNPHEFNPSRWLDGDTYQGDAVGPYANLLSFLGGPRTCLGWRFA
ncbi:cytochrome P450 [Mycena albidolilacea]|uniref:Cytochrome P450 n=1 Tax=Mycena albidolilacea TaxID=1033008 RepID=A0AAD6ZBL1_9AGAR|nr:cytochrome P450 [Mycena albidolilacea]